MQSLRLSLATPILPCVDLGKLQSPRLFPEAGNNKSLLSAVDLENPGEGCHKSELIREPITIILPRSARAFPHLKHVP